MEAKGFKFIFRGGQLVFSESRLTEPLKGIFLFMLLSMRLFRYSKSKFCYHRTITWKERKKERPRPCPAIVWVLSFFLIGSSCVLGDGEQGGSCVRLPASGDRLGSPVVTEPPVGAQRWEAAGLLKYPPRASAAT